MSRLTTLLNPFSNFTLFFQYVSHRVLRWSISALALPFVFGLNLYLAIDGEAFYRNLFIVQVVFYLMAIMGWVLENRQIRVKILFIPYYFVIMNYAVFAGFFRWIKGNQKSTWERARRAKN